MLNNIRFRGTIGGKQLKDYKNRIDWTNKNFDKRLYLLKEILNINDFGLSDDEFWQDIWDCGICKSNLNTTDTRWEETDVSKFLETMGSYLLYGYQKKEKQYRKEVELNEKLSYEDIVNDKNYRLAPPNKIEKSDYEVRELFSGTYEDYVMKVKDKGYEIKEKESWERIKYNEEEKVKLLIDAKHNLNILKEQMKDIKQGKALQFNKNIIIEYPKINVEQRLSKQLKKYGLSNEEILRIENDIYKNNLRMTNVTLYHLQDNLKDMKDYMISCKLAYTNRVMINPPKCSTTYDILDKIDYLDTTHIKAMLSLGDMKLDFGKDISILVNDINKKIKEMYSNGELSDKDIHIIEGIRYNVPHNVLGKELNINPKNISKTVDKICNNIVKNFYEEHIDLYFLNVSKGKYKKCNKCKEIKLINQFNKEPKGKDGYKNHCKKCR